MRVVLLVFFAVFVVLFLVVFAGRPKTERVGVHIFAETHHATLWTGG